MHQKTILKQIKFKGQGLHTGVSTNLLIKPSLKANTGIIFKYFNDQDYIDIKAEINNISSSSRCTSLISNCKNYKIYTVEHILSALYGLDIDNAIIEIDNIEVPILDGSSKMYVEKLQSVGIKEFNEMKEYCIIRDTIKIKGENDSFIEIKPYDGFKITFEIDFQNNKNIGKQQFTFDASDDYYKEISLSRTFCTFDEIVTLKKQNLVKGGNFENSIVYSSNEMNLESIKNFNNANDEKIVESIEPNKKTINNKKLYYENEAVRHKILDLIGDLALLGQNIKGHIFSYKGGHDLNSKLVKEISNIKEEVMYSKEDIKKVIPHREPFLLIDEIINVIDGKFVHAVKNISEDDIYLGGHFPGRPVMPGVLIIECLAQASCFLSMTTIKDYKKKLMLLSVIKKAKFLKQVIPGDRLELKVNLVKFKLNNAIISGEAIVNDKIVAKADWMATVVNR
tara:strand:- start:306 stop:1661 length:1356 start_codon:yes stop_codon:yes gene_type:complete